ncbi:hypothetical protein [Streptomyces beihaiensis]|uniref:YbjN domain-containing protein n=1 Tax=Streptomyces beihaiensis TaxID=2984495 RepID=A0ABT3TRC2_9ACTN|nr:hypothetical protein [Streptomyces beihaiensis]MCX3059599.1 hypothetical protein [Streptomyces beihaiensis]
MSDATAAHRADIATRDALRDQLRAVTGHRLAEVRVTLVRWDEGLRWVVLALTTDPRPPFGHREVPLHGSQHHDIAILLRDTFPAADWSTGQDYDVETGILRTHIVRLPDCLRDDDFRESIASELTESFDRFDRRIGPPRSTRTARHA